jgi:hypothetical protein
MPKNILVWLTEEEIKAVANMCQATLKMGEDSSYFERLAKEAESVLAKMKEKMGDN